MIPRARRPLITRGARADRTGPERDGGDRAGPGRSYTAAVANASGSAGTRGSGMTIAVGPDHPYEPYGRYGGMGAMARGPLPLFALSLVVTTVALVRL